jgi:hypothetical protein
LGRAGSRRREASEGTANDEEIAIYRCEEAGEEIDEEIGEAINEAIGEASGEEEDTEETGPDEIVESVSAQDDTWFDP